MTSLTKYERCDSWKSTVSFYSGSTLVDPSGNLAYIDVYDPNGTKIIESSGVKAGTGTYYRYINTTAANDLGIYRIRWYGSFYYDSVFGYMPRSEYEAVIITSVNQS